jgi:hypothetical protein
MIRGAIEVVTAESVQGWIYSERSDLRSHTILAFSGDQCVGSGRVEVFRPDLAEAGLGDGNLGFNFPISVAPQSLRTVVVKFEGSDAVILQQGASVGNLGADSAGLKRASVLGQLARLKWALKHGRLGQSDFDFLRTLYTVGVYERGLARRKSAEDVLVVDPWRGVARNLLEAYVALEVEIVELKVCNADSFNLEMARIAASSELLPIVVLHSEGPATLQVAEGSHIRGGAIAAEGGALLSAAGRFSLSPQSLLVLDSRASAQLALASGADIEIATAKAPGPD